MSRARRATLVVMVIAAFTGSLVTAGSALAASTAEDLERAKARLAELQRDADETTARHEAALSTSAELDAEIRAIETRIGDASQAAVELTDEVRRRALRAYTNSGTVALGSEFLSQSTVLDAARASELIGHVNGSDNDALAALRALRSDLERDRSGLERAQDDQQAALGRLQEETRTLEAQLRAAQEIRDRLESQLAAEQEARRAAAAEARARELARAQNEVPPPGTEGTDSSDTRPDDDAPVVDDPAEAPDAGASMGLAVCPIRGAVSFVDSWGAPRSGGRRHQGVDLMSPFGTPNVAVTSGRITQSQGPRQGNGVYLYGDNGFTYYYFHLSSYEGSPRRVITGEVIGYVGATGNTEANHTHFEIHPGGGRAVNPYPAVRSVC